ncbi:acyltransferase family protein [Sphaerimonospora cavernae]|uniref:Acyltransferase family protein n=1 Tax=Sphaerimonospora cavernae TaxID=1740611 RepID=A0ABV6U9W2_9ACTN
MSDIRHRPPVQVPQSGVTPDAEEEAPTGVISRITAEWPGPADDDDHARAKNAPGPSTSGFPSTSGSPSTSAPAATAASTPPATPGPLGASDNPDNPDNPARPDDPSGPDAAAWAQLDKEPLPVRRPRRRGAAGLGGTPDDSPASAEFNYFSTSRDGHPDPATPSAPSAAFDRPEPYGDWDQGGPATEIQPSQFHAPQWPDLAGEAAPPPVQWDPWHRTSAGPPPAGRSGGPGDSREDALAEGAPPPLPAWVPARTWDDGDDSGRPDATPEPHGLQGFPRGPEADPFGGRQAARQGGFGFLHPPADQNRNRQTDHERQADPEPDPAPRPSRRRQRDPYLDNVKFLLIALVPLGHSLVPTLAAHSARATYLFVYVFHMPLFVIISGYLSKNFWNSNAKTNKLVDTFVVPYVIVEVGYALLRTALGQKWSLTIMDPAWLNWYLVALLFWRLSTPVWKRMRYPVPIAVAIYLFAGFSNLSGDFSMDRFFGLMPFFVIGLVLKPEFFEFLRQRWVRVLSVIVLVVAAAVAIYLVKNYTVKLGPIYWKNSYHQLHLVWWKGMALRVALLAAALAMSTAVLSLIPRRETWFTDLGTRTLYCYLLHGVPVLIAKQMGWLSFPWLYGPLGVATIAFTTFALSIVLCLPITRTVFRYLLEPRLTWLYRRPRVQQPPAQPEQSQAQQPHSQQTQTYAGQAR